MALKKTIILDNGIPMEYHRIAEIQNVINDGTKIKILSYVNEEQRRNEQKIKKSDKPWRDLRPKNAFYVVGDIVKIPYNDTLDVVSAYEYLKTTEKYQGAEDVFEENEEVKITETTTEQANTLEQASADLVKGSE